MAQPFVDRLDPTADAYAENLLFESGAYLKYIVDHYETLSPVNVFIQ